MDRRYESSRRSFIVGTGAAGATALAGCLGDSVLGSANDSSETTVRFFPAWGGYYEDTFDEMITDFEDRHDDITVEWEPQGDYSESRSQAFSAANAGNPPDIAHLAKTDTITAIDSGFFTPVEEVIPDIDPDDYIGPAIGSDIVEGTLWSLPFNNSQNIMYYNREHFEEAGLDPDDPPQTFAEVADAATTIVEEGVAEYGITWPNVGWAPAWIAEQGEFIADAKNGREGEPTETYFSAEYSRRIFDWWMNDLGEAYHNPGMDDWGASEQMFQEGGAAMHLNTTGSLAYHVDGFAEQGIDVDVAPFFTPDGDSTYGHPMGGASIWITDRDRTDAELEALREFVLDMTGPEQQALYHRQTGYFPSHEEAFDILESEGWFEENEEFGVAYQQYQQWEDTPYTKGSQLGPWPEISDRLVSETAEMLGEKSIEEATTDLDAFAEEQLDIYERTI